MVIIGSSIRLTDSISGLTSNGGKRLFYRRPGAFAVLIALLAWSGLSCDLRAQEPAPPTEDLTPYAGMAIYNNPDYDSLVLVEFPFNLDRCELQFFQPDSADPNYYARVFAQVTLYGSDGLPVDSAKTYFSAVAPDLSDAARRDIRLFNSLGLLVKPGLYTARLDVIDAVSKREGSVFFDHVQPAPSRAGVLSLSGVRLAYSITPAGTDTTGNRNLIKNGYRVYTNVQNAYSLNDSLMYIYGELYNLQYSADKPSDFQLAYKVKTPEGEIVRDLGYQTVRKPGASSVIVEQLDMKGWGQGSYILEVSATDPASGQFTVATLPFKIWPPQPQLALTSVAGMARGASDPYDTLSVAQRIQLTSYLLNPSEKTVLSGLSEQGKINYLDRYWKEHDEDPTTTVIENRREMIRRYDYANEFFSTDIEHTNGWASDRGRVYMTWGPAEQIEDNPTPLNGNAYIIWWYHSQREGTVFVFEDKFESHDYTLVHSNARGEVYSQDWVDLLKQGSVSPY
jgi:GWxTD domain-containing protein